MDQAWQALCNSECNFRVMTEEDHPDYPTSPNPFASPAHKDFKLSKLKERYPDIGSRQGGLGIQAIEEALEDSKFKPTTEEERRRTGVLFSIVNWVG